MEEEEEDEEGLRKTTAVFSLVLELSRSAPLRCIGSAEDGSITETAFEFPHVFSSN